VKQRDRETVKARASSKPWNGRQVSRETCISIGIATRERVARWVTEARFVPRAGFFERVERMVATLALWGETTNLTSNPFDPDELAFHVIDSLAPIASAEDANRDVLEHTLGPDRRAVDLGSGAGFPGLTLAAAFDAHFTLVEARRKRASYLRTAAHEMDLLNVSIEQRRADPQSGAGSFDIATARAFGQMSALCEVASAALHQGGFLLVYLSARQLPEALSVDSGQLGEVSSWTYRLNHSGQNVERAALLLRKLG
jgi:16S rRNA (guanine(527)-N(7))-methyltransferase RsmG